MDDVLLVRLDPATEEAFVNDAEYTDALSRDDWDRVAACVYGRVGRTLSVEPHSVDALHWGGYFAVDPESRCVVGSCAFKGPPTNAGVVEIAYFTYPEFKGHGYATAMAAKLIALANRSPAVRRIIAHTMPERTASGRVLEKVGMRFDGEVIHPEDGRVWRWQMPAGGGATT
jgi:[ribosomal protein S5]-alanine N-acetyltransferase